MVSAEAFIESLLGKVVSHVWQGYGSAIFIEFGHLTAKKKINGEDGNPVGELTLSIEWSWRIERKHSILGGSWSADAKWPTFFKKIKGASVTKVEIFQKFQFHYLMGYE